jgi:TMEM175 potassium channel family protein
MARSIQAATHGAERGLSRFEGFSDAVFAIALTLLIVEIKVPGSPEGPHGYASLARAMAEQWREHLALLLCYAVIGAYWLQHHYSGRIYSKSDHWFGALNLLFLLAIVVIPYPSPPASRSPPAPGWRNGITAFPAAAASWTAASPPTSSSR